MHFSRTVTFILLLSLQSLVFTAVIKNADLLKLDVARPETSFVGELKQRNRRQLFGGEAQAILTLLFEVMALLQLLNPPAAAPAAPAGGPAPPAGGGAPAPPAPPAPDAAPAGPNLNLLLTLLALTGDDPDHRAVGPDNHVDTKCTKIPKGSVCDSNTNIHKLLSFPGYVLAVGDKNVFKIGLDGVPIDIIGIPKTDEFKQLNRTPTATLQIGDYSYVFFGSKLSMFKGNGMENKSLETNDISKVFFGIKTPVKGALCFNDHTLVIFLDTHFVFYQPLSNPPIDPRFSPQPTRVIPGGPEKIDGAVQINGTSFLYHREWMYQLSNEELSVVDKFPLRDTGATKGWLKCSNLRC